MIDVALGDYEKTVYKNGEAPGISANNLNKNENKTEELDNALATHLAEKATDEDLGHVKVDGETIIATNGVITAQTQIVDTVTDEKWEWGMEDGIVFLEKVVS